MADSEATATLGNTADEIIISVIIGDGVPGYWTVTLLTDGQPVRRWEGRSDDRLPDEVRLPRDSLDTQRDSLSWSVLLYGPSRAVPYHVELAMRQGGRSLLKPAARLSGELKPRKALPLSGVIRLAPEV